MLASLLQQGNPNAFLGYLLLAYGVMWLIAFVYVMSLVVQQRNIRRDIALLEQLLDEERPRD